MLITNKGEIPTLQPFPLPLLLKGTMKETTMCNFNFTHLQSQNYFYLQTHGYLLPGRMPSSFFLWWPPSGGDGDTSTTLGEGEAPPPPQGIS